MNDINQQDLVLENIKIKSLLYQIYLLITSKNELLSDGECIDIIHAELKNIEF